MRLNKEIKPNQIILLVVLDRGIPDTTEKKIQESLWCSG